jgi:predicted membrane protein
MDAFELTVLSTVVVLVLALAMFAAYTTVKDAKKQGEDWHAALFLWGCVFVFIFLLLFFAYNEIQSSI